ncbi:unnamed protein product [Orchesella dallaii]|uniref:Uncharacterized protein n=1 Tax=Orchesella dallaii TaxID=48710 RepID=A0ABP1PN91_9HEXA
MADDDKKKQAKPNLPNEEAKKGEEQETVVADTAADSTVLPVTAEEASISEEMEIEVLYRRVEELDESSSTERVPDLSAEPVPLALATPPQPPRNEIAATATSSAEDLLASSSSFSPLTPSEIRDLRKNNP